MTFSARIRARVQKGEGGFFVRIKLQTRHSFAVLSFLHLSQSNSITSFLVAVLAGFFTIPFFFLFSFYFIHSSPSCSYISDRLGKADVPKIQVYHHVSVPTHVSTLRINVIKFPAGLLHDRSARMPFPTFDIIFNLSH